MRMGLAAAAALACGVVSASESALLPVAGGGFGPGHAFDAHDPALDAKIAKETEAALARLERAGKLPPASPKPATGLIWPLAAQPGPGIDWHGVSNFVDLDTAFPNRVRDFTCGARSYDTAQGYNHNGTDFFIWPFPWSLMDAGTIDVVAAAAGTLIVKIDGRDDRSCSFNAPDTPNYVVIRHEDGRSARYLHLKNGSVTTKAEGDPVRAGEYLGKVGSSGISTGPHLHFEVREATTLVAIDPFSGQCQARPSLWAQQRPYYESRLNRIATHSAPPVVPGCPTTSDTPNLADRFAPGATVYVANYYRDQRHGQVSRMRLLRPDRSVQREWTFDSMQFANSPPHYNASYFLFSNVLPADAPAGAWTYEVTFEGTTLRQPFTVTGAATSCVAPTLRVTGPASGVAGAALSFGADVTAGGAVRLDWDVDGDGVDDRTMHNATQATLAATYPAARTLEIRVRATNASGCSAEARHALRIEAPAIAATASTPMQLCGDGDTALEPGERWQIPVRLRNGGSALANGHAVFAKAPENKAGYRLLAPTLPVPDLVRDAEATVLAAVAIDTAASCGQVLALDYVGTVDDAAHSLATTRVLDTMLGAGGACNASPTSCDAGLGESFVPRDGLYSSFTRFGNGIASFAIPTPGGTVFGGQWFTGRRDRTPEWLIVQGPLAGRQADAPVIRFRQTSASPFAAGGEIVGRALISYVSETEYVATWSVDRVAAGEKLKLLYGTNRPEPNRTGSWFAPSESGWGEAVDDHILPNGATEQVIVNYYYDRAGQPVWTLGGGPLAGGESSHNAFFVHCPSCPALPDFVAHAKSAGTVTTSFDGALRGTYSTRIDLPAPLVGSWQRDALRIELISEPQ